MTISPCEATQSQKALCLDGVVCRCQKEANLENENRRMLTAIEAILRIASDMLDPARRAGPGKGVGRETRGMCGLQEGRSTGVRDVINVEEEL